MSTEAATLIPKSTPQMKTWQQLSCREQNMERIDKVLGFALTVIILTGAVLLGATLGQLFLPIPVVGAALGVGVSLGIAMKIVLPKVEQFFNERASARRLISASE